MLSRRTLFTASSRSIALQLSLVTLLSLSAPAATAQDDSAPARDKDTPVRASQITHPVLWHQQTDIASLNLFSGQGGEKHAPVAPFTFVEEDTSGTNPKFDVTDAEGKKWRVKLGEETRPEVVASRLLWAMGYYANEDYVLPSTPVNGLALKRGGDRVRGGVVEDARFARKPSGQSKIGIWNWRTNPFYGSREFNGLRVMMAVMNNWDLKDVNNAVFQDKKTGSQIYLVSDVGASFGGNGIGFSKAKSKGNVDTFSGSGFIQKKSERLVSFSTPKKPTGMLLLTGGATAKSFSMRKNLDWIGNDIPRADARWMGSLLGQLTHQQLVDAFRAGHFPDADVQEFVRVVESRIADLKTL